MRGDRAHRRLIGTFAGRRRRVAAPEPLLPLPRDRQRHGRLGRAGRRHGRGDRRRWPTPRARAGAELRCGAEVDARSRPTATRAEVRWTAASGRRRAHVLCQRRPGRAGAAAGRAERRAARPRARSSRSTCCSRGCRGCATPPSTRARRSPARSTSTSPRRSSRRPTREAAAGRIPALAAVRDLLPLADRPDDPRPRAARRGRPDAHLLRAAHAGAAVRAPTTPPPRRGRVAAHAALARQRAGRADRGLPAGARPTASRASRRARRSSSRPSSGMPGGNIFHRDLAVAVRRGRGRGRALGRRDRARQRPALRRRRAPRRRRQRHPGPQRRHGAARRRREVRAPGAAGARSSRLIPTSAAAPVCPPSAAAPTPPGPDPPGPHGRWVCAEAHDCHALLHTPDRWNVPHRGVTRTPSL